MVHTQLRNFDQFGLGTAKNASSEEGIVAAGAMEVVLPFPVITLLVPP